MAAETQRIEITDPAAYQNKLTGLLAGRDPLTVLRETPDVFERIIRETPVATLRRRPYPERWTWTPLEVVGHLCDTEIVFAFRIRLILAADRPTITPMDQDDWVAAQRYNERDPVELVTSFRALRSVNIQFWASLTPVEMTRIGRHPERGEESLGLMLRMEAGHDLSHIDQLRKYVNA